MLPTIRSLRALLRAVIEDKGEQGHVVAGLREELDGIADSYDALAAFASRLATLPLRDDWPYVEPDDLEGIQAECDPGRPLGLLRPVDPAATAARVQTAFLGRVCGCVLGKPLEIDPTLAEIRGVLEPLGEWPLNDYLPERAVPLFRWQTFQWAETVRGRISYVAPDDDINYTILAMLLLEIHGTAFTHADIAGLWLLQLPVFLTFGPERTQLLKAGIASLDEGWGDDPSRWSAVLNPRDEYCGALIRADAYGYACAGRPALAAELAWREASWTHRRTGVYSTMFVAALIASALAMDDPMACVQTALAYVPRRSRFHGVVADAMEQVAEASDWLDGYARIHGRYQPYAHCRVYQEIGTLINTLRFAESVGDGICKQVMQGNDTDSFGATAGSVLGALFGPGGLESRWVEPFNDEVRPALALFHERSLSKLAERMGRLPARIAAEIDAAKLQ